MNTIEAIKTRRSIRKFTNQNISDETVKTLLECAMFAPSARNTQPWHFVSIDKREILNKIPDFHPFAEMCYNAQLAILVCGDFQLEKLEGYLALNCGAATQTILLSAHELGLGSVWLGVYTRKERMEPISKMFSLPENIIPIALIAIGYPSEIPNQPERYMESRIHKNIW